MVQKFNNVETANHEGDWVRASDYDALKRELDDAQKSALPSVDELAQIIRQVDGNHDLGAGILAEKILEKIEKDRDSK